MDGDEALPRVRCPLSPLTVSLDNAAATHDGKEAFTFDIRFSEEVAVSHKTLRDHAFNLTGVQVTKAQ